MKRTFQLKSFWACFIAIGLFSCNSKPAAEKNKADDGFHLSISSKDGEVKIDASDSDGKHGQDDGFHLNLSTKDGQRTFNGIDLDQELKQLDLELEQMNQELNQEFEQIEQHLDDKSKQLDRRLNQKLNNVDIKWKGKNQKLNQKVIQQLLPERIGWFKRTDYELQNALGLVSSAEATYTKGQQKVSIAILGGAAGSLAGSFGNLIESEFDHQEEGISQKNGEWNGLKYVQGYKASEKKAYLYMVLKNKVIVVIGGENMSEWNFNWWWKRIDWKKLEQ